MEKCRYCEKELEKLIRVKMQFLSERRWSIYFDLCPDCVEKLSKDLCLLGEEYREV
jgi:hypothetical protein